MILIVTVNILIIKQMLNSRKVLVEKYQLIWDPIQRQVNYQSTNLNVNAYDSTDACTSANSKEYVKKFYTVKFRKLTNDVETSEDAIYGKKRKFSKILHMAIKERVTDPGLKALENFVASVRQSSLLRRSLEIKRSKLYSRSTRNLLIISVCYILLNTVMVYSKLKYLFQTNYEGYYEKYTIQNNSTLTLASETTANRPELIDKNVNLTDIIASYLYYLNFSINFFLYVFSSAEFKDNILRMFKF